MGLLKISTLLFLFIISVIHENFAHDDLTVWKTEDAQRRIPIRMKSGRMTTCPIRRACKIFSLTDEFPEFMKILYELVNQQEAEGGEKFSFRTMEQLFKQYGDEFLPRHMPKLLDKIIAIIQELRAKYVDKINEKIEAKLANGCQLSEKRKRENQSGKNHLWGNMKLAELRIQTFGKMMAPKAFRMHVDEVIWGLGIFNLRLNPKTQEEEDSGSKLKECLKLIDEHWDRLPSDFQKELILKVARVGIVEENRLILARLLALARNLIRQFLKSEKLQLWNGVSQAYYDENMAKGIECHLERIDVVNYVTLFDLFGDQWAKNAAQMNESRLLSTEKHFWPTNLETGEALCPNANLYEMESGMQDFDVGLTESHKTVSPAPVPPLTDDQISVAFDIAIEHAVENPDCPLDLFGFLKQCQKRTVKYHNRAGLTEYLHSLCEKLRFGALADALVAEMKLYAYRKDAFTYPCAMYMFIGKMFSNASNGFQTVLGKEKILKPLKLDFFYQYCQVEKIISEFDDTGGTRHNEKEGGIRTEEKEEEHIHEESEKNRTDEKEEDGHGSETKISTDNVEEYGQEDVNKNRTDEKEEDSKGREKKVRTEKTEEYDHEDLEKIRTEELISNEGTNKKIRTHEKEQDELGDGAKIRTAEKEQAEHGSNSKLRIDRVEEHGHEDVDKIRTDEKEENSDEGSPKKIRTHEKEGELNLEDERRD